MKHNLNAQYVLRTSWMIYTSSFSEEADDKKHNEETGDHP